MRTLRKISAQNFLSLRKIDVDLQDLNVLVGPNGAGKSNLLHVIKFIGAVAKLDLVPAIESFGGFRRLAFAGTPTTRVAVGIEANITTFSSNKAPDAYELAFSEFQPRPYRDRKMTISSRRETLTFKRTAGRGRRITVQGNRYDVNDFTEGKRGVSRGRSQQVAALKGASLREESAALSTLRRLRSDMSEPVDQIATFFEDFEVYDIDVEYARRPSSTLSSRQLAHDANNLAPFLYYLKVEAPDIFEAINDDMRAIMPTAEKISFVPIGGSSEGVVLHIHEPPFKDPMPLAAASFGSVRALALLALLHNPEPPRLICVEEVDHGLHPLALDRIVDRMRGAVSRTQLIVATHSPALVNRLEPQELIVCERDAATGGSLIPAVDPAEIRSMMDGSELELGELWFSGVLSEGAVST